MLSGNEIKKQIALGNISITPFDPSAVGPNSVDLHLGPVLRQYKRDPVDGNLVLDTRTGNSLYGGGTKIVSLVRHPKIPDQWGWLLQPGVLYLGSTYEYTETRNFVPRVSGRSSLARLGVSVHQTAGEGDEGFKGRWTMELSVLHHTFIYPGDRYFQIYFEELSGDKAESYKGKYQNADKVEESKYHLDSHCKFLGVAYPISPTEAPLLVKDLSELPDKFSNFYWLRQPTPVEVRSVQLHQTQGE